VDVADVRIVGSVGMRESGHVSYTEAVDRARAHYARQLADAQTALNRLRCGDVEVYHQRGIYVERDRVQVAPPIPAG